MTEKYYGFIRGVDGKWTSVPLCENEVAAHQMYAEFVRKTELERMGVVDRFDVHRKRPLLDHLADFQTFLEGKGNTKKHAKKTERRIRAIITGCGFGLPDTAQASAVVDWLAIQRDMGEFNIKTGNYYLGAIQSFFRWMVKDRRIGDSPLSHLSPLNDATDDKLERRTLSPDEFTKLIHATRGCPVRIRLTGEDRAMLYLVAAYTGFRAAELASLTADAFDLDSDPPSVTVEAGYSKRRRKDLQPLRADLAEMLRDYLRRHPSGLIWPGSWFGDGAEMIRVDMAVAGIPVADESGRVFDFHALRHQFITNLANSGVHPRTAQLLARHSTIELTMGYTHMGLVDQTTALDNLPTLPTAEASMEAARATGTDGKPMENLARLLFTCKTFDSKGQSGMTQDDGNGSAIDCPSETQLVGLITVADSSGRLTRRDDANGPRGGMVDTGDLKSPGG